MKKYIVLCQPILSDALRAVLDEKRFIVIAGQFDKEIQFIEIPE